MAGVRELTSGDVDWAVTVLARRRTALVPHAPLYWRPAVDAVLRHQDFLEYVLGEGGGFGFRTDDGLMIAAPGGDGWTIDDAWVPPDAWGQDGLELWTATIARIGQRQVRFVCPVFEPERAAFAKEHGLSLATSWWHVEVPPADASSAGGQPMLDGASVSLVPAPPVYDPGGPITFLQGVEDVTVLERVRAVAQRCGSPLVVVDQPAGGGALGKVLIESGYVRHCDFFAGVRLLRGQREVVGDDELGG